MGLINYTQLQDNTPATANSLNTRFGAIVDTLNGNVDTQNLKASGVTREKIAPGAVTSDKLAPDSVLPSHMNNIWVGKSTNKNNVGTAWYTVFNKTITLAEAAYLYVLYNARGNANKAGDPAIQVLVNDAVLTGFSGNGGLELYEAKLNDDFPFVISAITDSKYSGDVAIKVQVNHSVADGWDVGAGFVRIDALGDGTYLG